MPRRNLAIEQLHLAAIESHATRDRPDILPVYVALTSGEPPPETKEVLDTEGGGAPLLRGAIEAFR